MKPNKKTYVLAALLLISLASALPINPISGSGVTYPTTSTPAQTTESTYPDLPLALFAAAAAALLIYRQAAKPKYITDGTTYRIDSSGKLYLPTGGGWTEATFSSDAAYLQYLRTSVKSSVGDSVAVRGADGKWALTSKSSITSYFSMLDSSQSKLTQLQKDLPGAKLRFFAAKRQSATSWMTRSAAAVYDKILGGIDAVKSTLSSLTSWLSDLTKLESSDKYGFKYGGRTYTYNSSGLVSIEAQSAYSRFKEEATATESSFSSELSSLFSGYSSHAAALGWSGVDLMKQRMKEIYQQHLAEIGAASREFSADYVKNGDWKHADKKRSELSSETKDDMKVLYEKYLEKLDELAYDKLVSAEEKARIAAEEARQKQEEKWRAQRFWDRNGDKIRAKLKADYVSSLAAAGKLRDSALKAYTDSVTSTYYDAFEKVGFLESHSRSGSEFDRYYLGYRSEVGDQQLVARDAKSLNRAADIMDALNKALAQGDVYLGDDVRYLQSYLSDVEESAGSQAYGWFTETLYKPWATQFEESWKSAIETEKEKLRKQAEEDAALVARQIAAGRAATADMIQKMQARDLLLQQIQAFGWGQYDPFNPAGVCVAPQTSLSSAGEESYLSDPGYLDAKKIYDFIDGIDQWIYKDLGGKTVDDFVHGVEGGAKDVGGGVWDLFKGVGEDIYDVAKPYAATVYSLSSFCRMSEDSASEGMDYWVRLGGVFGQRLLDDAAGLYGLAKLIALGNPVSWAKLGSGIGLSLAPEVIYIRENPQETAEAIKSDLASRLQLIQDSWSQVFSIQKPPETVDGAIDVGAARGFGLFGMRPGDTDLLTSLFGIRDDLADKRFDDATTKLAADTIFFSALSKLLGLGGTGGKTSSFTDEFSKSVSLPELREVISSSFTGDFIIRDVSGKSVLTKSVRGKVLLDTLVREGLEDLIPKEFRELLSLKNPRIVVAEDLGENTAASYVVGDRVLFLRSSSLELSDAAAVRELQYQLIHELTHMTQEERILAELNKITVCRGKEYSREAFQNKMAEFEYEAYLKEALARREAGDLEGITKAFFDSNGNLVDKSKIIDDYIMNPENKYIENYDSMYDAAIGVGG